MEPKMREKWPKMMSKLPYKLVLERKHRLRVRRFYIPRLVDGRAVQVSRLDPQTAPR